MGSTQAVSPRRHLDEALTGDHNFEQAGFAALLKPVPVSVLTIDTLGAG
jgi:hypothetical protein